MKASLLLLVLFALCSLALAQSPTPCKPSTTTDCIILVGDTGSGLTAPFGTNTAPFRPSVQSIVTQVNMYLTMQNMISGGNLMKAQVYLLGDMHGTNGSAVATDRALLAVVPAAVQPGTQWVTVQRCLDGGCSTFANDLMIPGTEKIQGTGTAPYYLAANSWAFIDEANQPAWEYLSINAVRCPTGVDATGKTCLPQLQLGLNKAHAAGFILRGSDDGPFIGLAYAHNQQMQKRVDAPMGYEPVAGNHDAEGGNSPDAWCNYSQPKVTPPYYGMPCVLGLGTLQEQFPYDFASNFYYARHSPHKLIEVEVLNTNDLLLGNDPSIQENWLTAHMQTAKGDRIPWHIAVGHHLPYGSPNSEQGFVLPQLRSWVAPAGIDAWFNGHWHGYEDQRAPNSAAYDAYPPVKETAVLTLSSANVLTRTAGNWSNYQAGETITLSNSPNTLLITAVAPDYSSLTVKGGTAAPLVSFTNHKLTVTLNPIETCNDPRMSSAPGAECIRYTTVGTGGDAPATLNHGGYTNDIDGGQSSRRVAKLSSGLPNPLTGNATAVNNYCANLYGFVLLTVTSNKLDMQFIDLKMDLLDHWVLTK